MSLTSPWQFGQFCYTHISTWGCLFEWQDSEFKLHLYVVTMSTLFWEEGLHNNWIHFVVKQWNMAHATYVLLLTKLVLRPFANILRKGLSSSFAPILTLVSLPIIPCTGTACSGSLSSNLGYASLLDGGGGFGVSRPQCPQKKSWGLFAKGTHIKFCSTYLDSLFPFLLL